MGWETTLSLGDDLVGIWRNHIAIEPTLLFTFEDFKVAKADGDESPSVVLSTTADRALVSLAANGISWELLVRDYAESRESSVALAFQQGLLMGIAGERQGTAESDCRAILDSLATTPPEADLQTLAVRVLHETADVTKSWSGVESIDLETRFRDALLFPELGEPDEIGVVSGSHDLTLEHLVLTRASDYFARNHAAAPLIGWQLAILLLLKHSAPDTQLKFDLSDSPDLFDADPPAVCERFWSEAREHLADIARFYGGIFSSLAAGTGDLAKAAQFGRLDRMLVEALGEKDVHRKGKLLEELIANLVQIPGSHLPILEKRLKHADEELDLVLRNDLPDSFWANFRSPLIVVECKNWGSKVDVGELRILETKIADRGAMCSIGIFVSLRGFSKPFLERVRALQSKGITVFPVSGDDLGSLVRSQSTLPSWLKEHGLRTLL